MLRLVDPAEKGALSVRTRKRAPSRASPKKSRANPKLLRMSDIKKCERTVQLLKLPDQVYWAIMLWSQDRSHGGKKVSVGDIYDEALRWFLESEARKGYEAYRAVPTGDATNRSMWVDSRLLERAGKYAERDSVPRSRVLYTALVLYVRQFGPVPSARDIKRLRKIKAMGLGPGRPILLSSK